MEVLHRYRIHVTISIDGPAEINDQLRVFPNGYKTHDLVLRNIQKLRAHGIEPAMVEATYTAVHERAGLASIYAIATVATLLLSRLMKGLQQEWRRITEASPCCFLKKSMRKFL